MIVVGTGVAGLSATLAAARRGVHVTLVTGGTLISSGNTPRAQGGIAVALGPGDSSESHLADTVAAGAGLVDENAARVLTRQGATIVRRMIAEGFEVDRAPDGSIALGLEGAHSAHRIVHAGGDRSGVMLHTFLRRELNVFLRAGLVTLLERHQLKHILMADPASPISTVQGVALANPLGELRMLSGNAVVIATGGYAGLYPNTTNAPGSDGHGLLIAARAGAVVADLEFVQFHPTVLHGTGHLVSEAVRGAGAHLIDARGARYMVGRHQLAELAPRDVVSRETHRVIATSRVPHVWLDATGIERAEGSGALARAFPGISLALSNAGYDWTREPVPVSPAAHYAVGGVVSDAWGRSSVPGLFVAGEVAATGVHGANRLASNSLLEGLVFGERAGHAAADRTKGATEWTLEGTSSRELIAQAHVLDGVHEPEDFTSFEARHGAVTQDGGGMQGDPQWDTLAPLMTTALGIERDAEGLAHALERFQSSPDPRAQLAAMIAASALAREESRGGHLRRDAPEPAAAGVRRAWRLAHRHPTQPDTSLAATDTVSRSLA